jgi:hypothetical protein
MMRDRMSCLRLNLRGCMSELVTGAPTLRTRRKIRQGLSLTDPARCVCISGFGFSVAIQRWLVLSPLYQ